MKSFAGKVSASLVATLVTLCSVSGFAQAKDPASYWEKTTFSLAAIQKMSIFDENCLANERHYLACIDAVNAILEGTEPGYVLSSTFHPPFPNTSVHSQVGNFLILKIEKNPKAPKKTPAQAVKESREEQAARDRVWKHVGPSTTGFAALLTAVGKLIDPKKEKYLSGEAMNAFFATAIDPHTYFKPQAYFDEQGQDSKDFVGIGALLESNPLGALVKKSFSGSPARAAGINRGDLITEVDGVSMEGMALDQIIEKILGPVDTEVKIKVTAANTKDGVVKTLKRQKIVVKKMDAEVLTTAKGEKVGYITLQDFMGRSTCEAFLNYMKSFETTTVGTIVDLRDNGGGNLSYTLCMLSAFTNPGQVLLTEQDTDSNQTKVTHRAKPSPLQVTKPIVVLINQFSASASEIFSGAIQDLQKGFVVGERSYGKGTVQGIIRAQDLGETVIAITQSRFHLPSGRSNQKIGVSPDFEAYPTPQPSEAELVSFREADIHRYPISEGEPIRFAPHPKLNVVKNCVQSTGQAEKLFGASNEYPVLVALDVLSCANR